MYVCLLKKFKCIIFSRTEYQQQMHWASLHTALSLFKVSQNCIFSVYTQRVRSRSEDRRARPEGGSSSSVAPTTTAGSLSAAADGPPEADPIARRRRGGHKTQHNVTSHAMRPTARHFGPFPFPHPNNYFRLTNSTSGRGQAPQTQRRSTPVHEVQRF